MGLKKKEKLFSSLENREEKEKLFLRFLKIERRTRHENYLLESEREKSESFLFENFSRLRLLSMSGALMFKPESFRLFWTFKLCLVHWFDQQLLHKLTFLRNSQISTWLRKELSTSLLQIPRNSVLAFSGTQIIWLGSTQHYVGIFGYKQCKEGL